MQGSSYDARGARRKGGDGFDRAAARVAVASGNPVVTLLSIVMVLAWFATGEHYRWSDTWQLVIQTVATVITLPLLFILQNSHNRQAETVNAKLDAVLHAQALLLARTAEATDGQHELQEEISALQLR